MHSTEFHPLKPFLPTKVNALLVGTFPGKEVISEPQRWYYGSPRNQFWKILSLAFSRELGTVLQKQELLEEQGIAIVDVIASCQRKSESNLDSQLKILSYNTLHFKNILTELDLQVVFFTSKFAKKLFAQQIEPHLGLSKTYKEVLLPSPSPAYAVLSLQEKAKRYKELFAELQSPSSVPFA